MNAIRIAGHIDENGHLQVDESLNLPPGDVIITVEPVPSENEDVIDAKWDELLTSEKSLEWLQRMGTKALADLDAGETEEIDPDTL